VQSCLVESNVISPKPNRLPGKDDWSVRCSQWHERLSEEQIKYAALDAIAGSCIDHVLNNTPDKVRYTIACPPPLGTDLVYIVGPLNDNVIGLRCSVVPRDVVILNGPHVEYDQRAKVQLRLIKVTVTETIPGLLVTLPYPRMDVTCSMLSNGVILWLPMNKLRPWGEEFRRQFHERGHCTAGVVEHVDNEDTNTDSDDVVHQDPPVSYAGTLPHETSSTLDAIWEDLKLQLDSIKVGDTLTGEIRRVQVWFIL
jgi:hypothetical protein